MFLRIESLVGCSDCRNSVSVEVDQRPMAPRIADLAAVLMGNRLGFVVLQAEVSRGAALSFVYCDG
jgi:hypothetical protein